MLIRGLKDVLIQEMRENGGVKKGLLAWIGMWNEESEKTQKRRRNTYHTGLSQQLAMSPVPQDFGDVVAHYNILAAVSSLMLHP
jgi:hypothetical protein